MIGADDGFYFEELVEPPFAVFAAIAGLFLAAERGFGSLIEL